VASIHDNFNIMTERTAKNIDWQTKATMFEPHPTPRMESATPLFTDKKRRSVSKAKSLLPVKRPGWRRLF